ncbi:uncharacterized protein [Halyomorpha halys]|uniref:uncharacterized protein n=1 Tax=Halyomorpha halys TaxID=286706 RepID=UPI0006D4C6C5|nr:mucin-5AC [Halyomorpha halys]
MKIYHLIFLISVLTNGLLSVVEARLKCPSVSFANGIYKIRSKGRIIVYKCARGFYMLGDGYAACIKGKWDSNPPVCLKPGCPRLTNLLNGEVHESWRSSLVKFTCDPGYKLIGPSYIYCNGRQWSAAQPHCQAVDIKCDFEKKTTCNWIIDDYDDEDFNWRLQQHEPPSRVLRTGPLHDHTLSPNTTGHYLLLDTSDYMPSSKPARIHSPVFPQPADNSSCFIFWYHMYGNTIGTLNVFLNNVLAFQRQGNHGDRWIKGIISLSENVTSSDLQIIIEGSYGGGYTGDIGLDDFSIANGTDCSISTVKSCVGRCYEDKNDYSTCLCNPECSVDASCCEDFMDVCRIESTTPFFEASTEVEDSSQVYSDTSGTTDYETNFSETTVSSTELEFTATSGYSTDSTSFTSSDDLDPMYSKADVEEFETTNFLNNSDDIFYTSSTNPNIDKENTKSHSTIHDVSDTESHSLSTIPYVLKERELTLTTEDSTVVNKFSPSAGAMALKNINTKERATVSYSKNNITVKSFYNITTEPLICSHVCCTCPFTDSQPTTSTKADKEKSTKFIFHPAITTRKPQVTSIKKLLFNVSTLNKTLIPSNKSTTFMPLKMNTLRTKEPVLKKNVTTPKKLFLNQSSTATTFRSTKVFQTTPLPKLTSSSTSKSTAKIFYPLVTQTHLPATTTSKKIILVQSSTNATLKNLKSITPSLDKNKFYFNITTVSPKFYNVTTASTSVQNKITTSKVDIKKILNDSHTHLQTTSRLPLLLNTTEASLTSIITNTVTVQHYTTNRPKKWKSIYKPKDKFMFSAVQRNKDSNNQTYVILSTCAALIGVISTLLVVLFIRKRRLRLVNELEEADTDILYHSSQEMLDLHIARPNH